MTEIGYTPTTQQFQGWPYGDCVRASYATLLDLPIESVPRFDPAVLGAGENQRDRERAWLATMGLDLIEVDARSGCVPDAALGAVADSLHLISGLSPRGFGHRCVGYGGQVLFDPHPSRAGLIDVWSIGLVVPKE